MSIHQFLEAGHGNLMQIDVKSNSPINTLAVKCVRTVQLIDPHKHPQCLKHSVGVQKVSVVPKTGCLFPVVNRIHNNTHQKTQNCYNCKRVLSSDFTSLQVSYFPTLSVTLEEYGSFEAFPCASQHHQHSVCPTKYQLSYHEATRLHASLHSKLPTTGLMP